jgi:class 3 adenylate cyclase/predicted ATPase
MRFEHEAAPVRVHERMALTSVDLLSSIVTARPARLGGLGALAVDDCRRGAGVAPDPFAIGHYQRVVYPFKAAVVAPSGKPAVNRPPWWQVVRQQPPRAARPHDIEDAVDDLPHRPGPRPARWAGLRQVRRDHPPLSVGQIGLVSRDGAAMLLSSGWRPHGESKLVGETPWNRGGPVRLNRFQKLPLTRARGLNLNIDGWLRRIGLEQYAQTFRDNAIDADVLRDLTDEHLRELGLPLGARLKLLRAVAALSIGQTPISPEITTPAPRTDAERRQVTVMFSDLVGSTALSARMDPEDLREVISAYQKCVAETVQRFGGFVAKYMGDGVLIYFGYPQAHEDDAERAVRAGLELVAAVGALKTHAPLQARVGIATGLVVVGDLIGSGASQEQAIVGDTPNLAARLQGVAEPNSVVMAESTRRLVGNLFELEDLGAQDLKGIAGRARSWAVLRASSAEGRFEAFHASGLTELVGREEELEILLRRWSKAKSGEGQVVLLSGEPGIGKSRLTAALMERLDNDHTRFRYFCSPQHTDSALHPIISQMERAAGFTHDDNSQAKLDKLDALLSQSSTPPKDAALLADMLSLPNDRRYPTLELDPQQRRQKTLEALTAQLEALGKAKPVLMIFEDVHWIDPTSLEAVSRTVDRLGTLEVLLIFTYRPEFDPPWIGRPYVTALTLNRLGEHEIIAMIDRVTGNKALPEGIRQDIMERTDGVPLFVEEMTKAVLEAESEDEAQRTTAGVPSPALAVPASLHASLMSRLDRLGAAKEVAQIGAAVGREFSHTLLAAVAGKSDEVLQAALDRLITAGLLFRQGVPPHASYLFKHALVQDAAYGTLLREGRRALHARIAETLESQFAETADNQPELLARHCSEAGLIEKAVGLWSKAGTRSLARAALFEGAEQLKRALDQIATLPTTPALRREEIRLHVAFGNALTLMGNFVDGKEHFDRALAIYDPAEHRPLTTRSGRDVGVTLLSVRSGCLWHLGYPAASREEGERAVSEARKIGHAATLMYALWWASWFHMRYGAYAETQSFLDELAALAAEKEASLFWKATETAFRGALFALTGKASDAVRAITSGMTSLRLTGAALYEPWHLWHLAMAYADLGQPDDARRCIDDAIDKVERSKEKWLEAEVYRIAGEVALKSPAPDTEKAEKHFERALSVAHQQQQKSWELRAAMSLARLWRDQGKVSEARELLAPVYGWFTEGFDTRDLREAKALLEELAA